MSQKENLQSSEKYTWAKYIHYIKMHNCATKLTQTENKKRNNTNKQDVNIHFPGKKIHTNTPPKENIGRYIAQKQK